jgi:hypothetical protein
MLINAVIILAKPCINQHGMHKNWLAKEGSGLLSEPVHKNSTAIPSTMSIKIANRLLVTVNNIYRNIHAHDFQVSYGQLHID